MLRPWSSQTRRCIIHTCYKPSTLPCVSRNAASAASCEPVRPLWASHAFDLVFRPSGIDMVMHGDLCDHQPAASMCPSRSNNHQALLLLLLLLLFHLPMPLPMPPGRFSV